MSDLAVLFAVAMGYFSFASYLLIKTGEEAPRPSRVRSRYNRSDLDKT